ncbi:MAG: alkaline phosphatase [Acidobacteria bacterium 13_1_40CM_4_69_4]|nr:MAG: alkaline phosphatase [Acidobacteria bacterium 13_1_40CM_4_69_4]
MVTDLLKWVAAFITAAISSLGYLGVFLMMAIESAAIPLPSEIIMPFSGFLAYRNEFTLHGAAFWGAAGCVFGSWAAYAAAAWGGRPFVERYGRYVFISRRDLDLAERLFRRYGSPIIFFSRLLPVVRTFISLPAGLARMPLGRFTVYTFVGSYPFCYALAYLGYTLGEHWHTLESSFRKYDVLVGVFLACAAVWWIRRHLVSGAPSPQVTR